MNRNGRLDENEWGGRYADLKRLDANRDGKVTSNEYVEQGAAWQKRQRFDDWDTNRNALSMRPNGKPLLSSSIAWTQVGTRKFRGMNSVRIANAISLHTTDDSGLARS